MKLYFKDNKIFGIHFESDITDEQRATIRDRLAFTDTPYVFSGEPLEIIHIEDCRPVNRDVKKSDETTKNLGK